MATVIVSSLAQLRSRGLTELANMPEWVLGVSYRWQPFAGSVILDAMVNRDGSVTELGA